MTGAPSSPAASAPLPATRLIRRLAGDRRGFGIGVLVTVTVNGVLMLALVAVTRQHREPPTEPLATTRLVQVEPPAQEPPAQEPPPEPDAAVPTPSAEPILPSLPLPPLDLAPAGDAAMQLPILPSLDTLTILPLGIPAFTAATVGSGALAVPSAQTALAFDEPAQLNVAFDLDRFYPRQAKLRGIEGETVIRFTVGVDGVVTDCVVMSSLPTGVFDQSALHLAASLRFTPAKRAGTPVASTFSQHILWTLKK